MIVPQTVDHFTHRIIKLLSAHTRFNHSARAGMGGIPIEAVKIIIQVIFINHLPQLFKNIELLGQR